MTHSWQKAIIKHTLNYLINLASDSGLNDDEYREAPEESIGLSLAVNYAKLSVTAEILSYGSPIKDTIEKCYPRYVTQYIKQVNKNHQERQKYYKQGYPQLNQEAIIAVYEYMAHNIVKQTPLKPPYATAPYTPKPSSKPEHRPIQP